MMIPELVACLDRTMAFIFDQLDDLTDNEMILQPRGFPNHAAWTVGHIVYSCQAMAVELGIKSWLPEDWESDFGQGSTPGKVMSDRLRKTLLLPALKDSSRRLRAALLEMKEGDMADPLPDEKSRKALPTKGHALVQIIAAHTAYHAGQLAAWRRAIDRRPSGLFL
jgi:hypothetical protein